MKITGSFLGNVTQQFGKSIVGSNWKGINYVRKYVIPSNPRTIGQIAQRSLFSSILLLSISLLVVIENKFWKKQAVKMSPYNAFMKANLKALFPIFDTTKLIFSKGSMTTTLITGCSYNTTTGSSTVVWPNTLLGNQTADDKIVVVFMRISNQNPHVFDTGVLRRTGTLSVQIGSGIDASDLACFVFFYRDLGTVTESISSSLHSEVNEA